MLPRVSLYQVEDLLVVEETKHVCTRNFGPLQKRQTDTTLLFIFHVLLPAIFIIICSVGCYRNLAKMNESGIAQSEFVGNDAKGARRILRVSSTIGASYLIGWLPVHVSSFLQEFYDYDVMGGREVYTLCVFFATFAVAPLLVIVGEGTADRNDEYSISLQGLKEYSFSESSNTI